MELTLPVVHVFQISVQSRAELAPKDEDRVVARRWKADRRARLHPRGINSREERQSFQALHLTLDHISALRSAHPLLPSHSPQ